MSKLDTALAKAYADIKKIDKNGKNTFQKYKFVQSEDVLAMVRPILHAHDIAFYPSAKNITFTDLSTNAGKLNRHCFIEFEFTLSHAGESRVCTWYGEALDTSDKCVNKAQTAAVKTFLMKLFLLSTADEVDPDSLSPTVDALTKDDVTRELDALKLSSASVEKKLDRVRQLWSAANQLGETDLVQKVQDFGQSLK